MKDLFVCCPFHEGDRTPSLSVLLQDKNGLKAGFSHCFGCGWSGNYKQVEKAMGRPLDIEPEIRSVLEQGSPSNISTQFRLRSAVASGSHGKPPKKCDLPFKYSRYLAERGIGEVVQRFNKVYQDSELNMPFFDVNGNFMGSAKTYLK